jgi:hypothetical protein
MLAEYINGELSRRRMEKIAGRTSKKSTKSAGKPPVARGSLSIPLVGKSPNIVTRGRRWLNSLPWFKRLPLGVSASTAAATLPYTISQIGADRELDNIVAHNKEDIGNLATANMVAEDTEGLLPTTRALRFMRKLDGSEFNVNLGALAGAGFAPQNITTAQNTNSLPGLALTPPIDLIERKLGSAARTYADLGNVAARPFRAMYSAGKTLLGQPSEILAVPKKVTAQIPENDVDIRVLIQLANNAKGPAKTKVIQQISKFIDIDPDPEAEVAISELLNPASKAILTNIRTTGKQDPTK